jgi:hypothetical protein
MQPWDRFLTEQDREGMTVSGCGARAGFGQRPALLIDAFGYNDRCALVSDASFDRFEMSHAASLFDMGAKYADIVESGEVLEFFAKLGSGLFANLPTGLANA